MMVEDDILLVAPLFPPAKTVGAMRLGSLATHLVENGEKVTVLTEGGEDSTVLSDRVDYIYADPIVVHSTLALHYKKKQQYEKLLGSYLRSHRPKCAVITCGPFYTVGLTILLRNASVPCILDYRDPWLFDVRESRGIRSNVARMAKMALFSRAEKRAISCASALTTPTEAWAQEFSDRYKLEKERVVVIRNGYDDRIAGIAGSRTRKEGHAFTLGVFGKLFYYSKQSSEVLLGALRDERLQDVCILQVGEEEACAKELLGQCGVEKRRLKSTGFIDYVEGATLLAGSADAFLIVDSRMHALGTKVYDYAYLGKPIIYIGPREADLGVFVGELPQGFVCETIDDAIEAIERLSSNDCFDESVLPDSRRYARSVQNERWHGLIKELSAKL